MTEANTETASLSDNALVDAVRAGSVSAYETLYERHSGAAQRLARQLTRCSAEADDLVSEAFAKVLETLRKGDGPSTAFRAYTLRVLQNEAYQRYRREGRVSLQRDFQDLPGTDLCSDPSSSMTSSAERTLIAKAFAELPERWRTVLWYTEIEGMAHAEIAPLLGLNPSGVAALAYRAREGMRQAYLQAHIAGTASRRCRATIDRLGVWTRNKLSRREATQVETHLDRCERCRARAAELVDLNRRMRAVVAPLVLGPAAAGYLRSSGNPAMTSARATDALVNGSGSIASLPQQVAAVAASTTALVAAVVLGMTTGANESPPPAVDVGSPAVVRENRPAAEPPSDRSAPIGGSQPGQVAPRVPSPEPSRPTPDPQLPPEPSRSTPDPQPPQPVAESGANAPALPPTSNVVPITPQSPAADPVGGTGATRPAPSTGAAAGIRVELSVPGNSPTTGLLPGGSEANEQIDVRLVVDVDVSVTKTRPRSTCRSPGRPCLDGPKPVPG